MKSYKIVLITALLVAAAAKPCFATLITASDNAFVRGDNKSNNKYSVDEDFEIKRTDEADQGTTRTAFLRFNVSTLSALDTYTSVSIDLNFTKFAPNTSIFLYGLVDSANAGAGTTETTWAGNSLMYDTRPDGVTGVTNAHTTALMGQLDFPAVLTAGEYSIILDTTAFKTLLGNDTNGEVTFILTGSSTSGAQSEVSSITNTGGYTVPTLNVIPEPATTGMLGLGAILILLVRRIRH